MRHILALLVLASCTDATTAQFMSYGSPGHITCYSGGKVIYEGDSSGKIQTEKGSDGWFFREVGGDGKLIRVSGDCVIKN